MIRRRVFASGVVQGVSYRASTFSEVQRVNQKQASPLRGYVRNLPDGRVEAVFQGEEESVQAMLSWCRKGPRAAVVTDLQVLEEKPDPDLPLFEVQI